MRYITPKNLKKHIGKSLWIEREGIKGNHFRNGEVKEGELSGVLCKDDSGFYIKMYKTYWGRDGTVFNKNEFFDEPYRLRERDIIHLRAGIRIVRISDLEKK